MLISTITVAQTYMGKIVDVRNEPIAYANVVIRKNNDNTIVTGSVSNENGEFLINIKEPNVYSEISFVGFVTKRVELSSYNLGIITLKEAAELEEVVITARKKIIQQKVDRLVFNVENSVAATGGSGLDALKLTPRIKVQNDKISMIGKGNMRVMLNGRVIQMSGDDLANYLKSLSSDDIKSIEVITNPPARYSAEGDSGLINIVLKKNKSNAWNASLRSVYQQATYAKGNIGGSFNMQKGKFQFNSAIGYTNGSSAPVETEKIYYPSFNWSSINNRRDFSNTISTRLGIEYKINNRLSTGLNYRLLNNNPLTKEIGRTELLSLPDNKLDSTITTLGRNKYNKKLNSLKYYLTYSIDTVGKKISFDFDLFNYRNEINRFFDTRAYLPNGELKTESIEKARNYGIQDIKNYSVNIDMEHPNSWASFNYGIRFSVTETENIFNYFDIINEKNILNINYSNEFNYKESTQAPYVSIHKNFSEKWEMKTGIRYEFTQTKGFSKTLNQTNTNNYSKLFPTVYLSYTPNNTNSISINYGKRISRPSFNFLNPFKFVNSSYSYSEGNPILQPAFIDNVELAYIYKNKFITNIYYSYTDDNFEQVTIIDKATKSQRITPLNFIINKKFGVNQSFMFKPTKWWNIYTAFDIYYSDTSSKIPVTLKYLKGWNAEFNVSNDISFNYDKTFLFNTNLWFVTKGVDNLDYNSSDFQLNASIRWILLGGKLTVSLSLQDIINPRGMEYTSFSNNIKNSFKNYFDEQYFRLGIKFNFGKKFRTSNRKRKNQNEQNRIN